MGTRPPENTMSGIPRALGVGVIVGFLAVMNAGCDKGKSRSEETQGGANPRGMLTLDLGNGITMKLVLIPAGRFMMGSPYGSEKVIQGDEIPQHDVTISKPFYMGVCEVTQEQYERIMGRNPSFFKGAQNPVEFVSWEDAVDFCKKLSQNVYENPPSCR
jgi:formylglycine-generating enzyme required for sulfatase activity